MRESTCRWLAVVAAMAISLAVGACSDEPRAGAEGVGESGAFVGRVENTTRQTLCAVRVEVHLSTGTELGPTERTDLPSGEAATVELPTAGEVFDTWTAHPEVSPCTSM